MPHDYVDYKMFTNYSGITVYDVKTINIVQCYTLYISSYLFYENKVEEVYLLYTNMCITDIKFKKYLYNSFMARCEYHINMSLFKLADWWCAFLTQTYQPIAVTGH